MSIASAFKRLETWLDANAPRTRAALLPPARTAELKKLPAPLAELYRLSGGQGPDAPAALFPHYFFMALRGTDGVVDARERMPEVRAAGGEWATKERWPFAKDFGGNYLFIDMAEDGAVIEVADGESLERAESLEAFLTEIAEGLEDGSETIDDTIEETETFEVVFDASRSREVGERVTHSVFTKLAIDAFVEPLDAVDSAFDKKPAERHGFAVRLVPPGKDISVEVDKLVARTGAVRETIGKSSGGGKEGVVVYVDARRPLPEASRLHIRILKTRRV